MKSSILLQAILIFTAGCVAKSPQTGQNPVGTGVAPVIDSVQFHTGRGQYSIVYPEFHFHAADGNVNAIHRDLVSTTSPMPVNFSSDAPVRISAEQQKRGAVYVGGWHCGPEAYDVNIRAYLIDEHKNRSNSVDYTVHCPGTQLNAAAEGS